MLLKDDSGRLSEVIGRLGGGLELLEQGERLAAHRLLNHWQLAQRCTTVDRLEPNSGSGDATLASGSPQRSTQSWPGQAGGLGRCWRDGKNGTRVRMRQTTGPSVFERLHKRRVVLVEQRAELVSNLLAVPGGVLLRARQYGNGLRQLRVYWQWTMRRPVRAQNVGQQLASTRSDLVRATLCRSR
jgi:hypothetical protein